MISSLVEADAVVQHDDGDDFLAEPVVWLADDGGLADAGVGEQDFLDLARVDVVPAADHQVLGPVDDEVEAVLVRVADVAGVQPAAGQRARCRLRPVPVALHDVVPADLDLAELIAPRRQRLVAGVGDAHLHAPDRLADRQRLAVAWAG